MAGEFSRPRGFAPWNPQAATLVVLEQIEQVFVEYRDHLPLTARQIFYRLVGEHDFEKTEQAYGRLCEYLVRARRAQLIPFWKIRDDGATTMGGGGYTGPGMFWRVVRRTAETYKRDRQIGQPTDVELWCEAKGMAPMMARVARPYSIPVYSTGGFSSVTITHEIAERVVERQRPTVLLHVGDYDPSGESIFNAIAEDAEAFVTGYAGRSTDGHGRDQFRAVRVALTREQVDEYDLDTAPPKKSDQRSKNWGDDEAAQLEAMPPDLLMNVVTTAIEQEVDSQERGRQIGIEEEDRASIERVLDTVEEEEGDDGD